jgi:hypothetical protein
MVAGGIGPSEWQRCAESSPLCIYFNGPRRFAIELNGHVTVYDLLDAVFHSSREVEARSF